MGYAVNKSVGELNTMSAVAKTVTEPLKAAQMTVDAMKKTGASSVADLVSKRPQERESMIKVLESFPPEVFSDPKKAKTAIEDLRKAGTNQDSFAKAYNEFYASIKNTAKEDYNEVREIDEKILNGQTPAAVQDQNTTAAAQVAAQAKQPPVPPSSKPDKPSDQNTPQA